MLVGLVLLLLGQPGIALARTPYAFSLTGMPDETTRNLFEETSELIARKDEPPPSRTALRNRIRGDLERIRQVLNAYGYFDARIEVETDEEAEPVPVAVKVTAGPRYDVGTIRMTDPGGVALGPGLSPPPLLMALKEGQPYEAQPVLDSEGTILSYLGRQGRPFARVDHRDVVLDRDAGVVNVTWAIDYGPRVTFGPVRFEGLERLKDKPARALIRWEEGEIVDIDKVEETRQAFVATGLLRGVNIDLERPPAGGTVAPVLIRLTESPPRTIGGGIRYSTSEGAGVRAFWEHRNLLGGRESLRVTADVAMTGYSLAAKAKKPDFEWNGVDLVFQAEAAQEELDAYDRDSLLIGGGLEWRYSPQWFFSGGLTFEQSAIDDNGKTENYTLFGLPVVARNDTSNDALDPTNGHRLTFALTPYYDLAGTAGTFIVGQASGSTYLPLDDAEDYVLALRAALGATFGGSTLSLPADKRFYAGGGNSVRGFAYQAAGPLGVDGDPQGGKSMLTGAVELRWRVTESIGVVPFVDVGSVYDDSLPDFGADLFIGAGLGLRYRSPIGPLRLDVATPVSGKRDSDDIVQIYISIGQAF
ncbi:autotransporter assembly complex protein TamA [Zavarzinia compransoris]|uniref:autotransporter assembly complex protein TamA n=1 Tax=Zavarzinia marina TaxID=2911065 RepID=UPI001F2F9E2A|nr:autotransporter assembly complex family protein [Zavarzinia marina]MCF4165951.1 autotransporter assembly complex protein TamA [Zavarzinia marina]